MCQRQYPDFTEFTWTLYTEYFASGYPLLLAIGSKIQLDHNYVVRCLHMCGNCSITRKDQLIVSSLWRPRETRQVSTVKPAVRPPHLSADWRKPPVGRDYFPSIWKGSQKNMVGWKKLAGDLYKLKWRSCKVYWDSGTDLPTLYENIPLAQNKISHDIIFSLLEIVILCCYQCWELHITSAYTV